MKKIKIGDVFKIYTPKGMAYFQYVFQNQYDGELIRTLPGLYDVEPLNLQQIVNKVELYYIHFPVKAALNKAIVNYVGNFELPVEFKLPEFMRSNKIDRNGNFECWHIIDYTTSKRVSVKELSKNQLKLSPWGIWNDTLLVERLSEGWTPELWKRNFLTP